jgi:AraC-like DNA-binding protein
MTVRIGTILALPEVLQDLGVDPAEVIRETGCSPALFDDPDNRIGFVARGELLEHCARRAECPHLGLLVGQRGGMQSLGLIGLLSKNSPDVETALRNLDLYFHLHVQGATVRLRVEASMAMLAYLPFMIGTPGVQHVGDGAVVIMQNIMRGLCGEGWNPTEVRFAHRRPANVSIYRKFFDAPLAFDAEEYGLVFPKKNLAQRLAPPDAELGRLLIKQVASLEGRFPESFPDHVRAVLSPALLTGQASASQVAAMLSMHVRTLSRRLNQSGSGFRELLDEQRKELACRLLRDTDLNVGQVAAIAGYSDPSAFGRAFRRWTGDTPAQWRSRPPARKA